MKKILYNNLTHNEISIVSLISLTKAGKNEKLVYLAHSFVSKLHYNIHFLFFVHDKSAIRSVSVLILALVANGVFGQDYPNQIRDPCVGRISGVARDLASCRHYFWCSNGSGSRGVCPNNELFDGESERCVFSDRRPCFECSATEAFHLNSVPNACSQYIQCFNRQPTLHLCPSGLVYDGRNGIRQCNIPPPSGGCLRENGSPGGEDSAPISCPPVTNSPVFIRHPYLCAV